MPDRLLVAEEDGEVHGCGHFVEVRGGYVEGYRLETEGAVFQPVGFCDFVDERGFDLAGGSEVGHEIVEEGEVVFHFFAFNDESSGSQAMLQCVLAGNGFARFGARAGG